MTANETVFKPTVRTRLKRLHARARYDTASVHAVLDAGFICHVGYVIDGQPYVTPTSYWREGDQLYWHGSSASRMLRTLEQGVPCCVTVTHLDGLVLARSGFHHSVNYRSVMAFGQAALVTDSQEKRLALDAFIERLYPGRAAMLRPATRQELKATSVMRMALSEAVAKVRSGPPVDDEPDYALDVWAGVVPASMRFGKPLADPKLRPGIGPDRALMPASMARRLAR